MWCKEFTTTLRNDLACHLVVCRPLRLLQCIGCCDSGELNPPISDRTVVVGGGHMRSKVFLPSSDGTVATARRPKINTIAALALKISADAESKAPVYDKKWLIAANRHPESKTLLQRALKALESDLSEDESKDYRPYNEEKVKERTSNHPSIVCSDNNCVKVQIKTDRYDEDRQHDFKCDVPIKQENFSDDESADANDSCLAPRAAKINAKVNEFMELSLFQLDLCCFVES